MMRYTCETLRRELRRAAGRPVELTLTSNASSYVSFIPGRRPLRARVHRGFLYAPPAVITALGRWLGGHERRCPAEVRLFINNPPPEVVHLARSRRRRLRSRGRCYDLRRILRRVNAEHLGGRVTARITWGRRGPRRDVRARTLGAYYRADNLIVINPILDQPAVPEWFVAFTVYHECLHTLQTSGARPHNRAFREALRRHPQWAAATRWEKEHIGLLTGREAWPRGLAAHRARRRPKKTFSGQLRFPWS